jgi:NADPH:quinone reductase-like Zn-dependent oxidoreductase
MLMNLIPSTPLTRPWIPEIEFSGEVIAAGDNAPPEVRDPGTHVIGFQSILGYATGRGVLAEYIRVPGKHLARIDPGIDMAAASGINGAGSCALKMCRKAGVREGHVVLVNGASGSVGSVLVQLCKVRGARVVGVASGGNEEMVRGLGVDEVCFEAEGMTIKASVQKANCYL